MKNNRTAFEIFIQHENKYRALIEKAHMAVLIVDKDDLINFASPAILTNTGLFPELLVGKNVLDVFSAENESELYTALAEIRKTSGLYTQVKNLSIIHTNGQIQYFDAVLTNLYNDPEVNGCVIQLHNVTSRRQTEQELREINFELDSFVYRASHDMRAPLLSLLGLIDVMQKGIATNTTQCLELVKRNVLHLDRFLIELTEHAKNENQGLTIEKIDFASLIQEAITHFQYLPQAEKINFDIEVLHSSAIYSDLFRLKVILNNLICNAIKYHDFRKENPYVKIVVEGDEQTFTVSIRDNGTGIMDEYCQKVFDMFFRATSQAEGSGLGLYIVKKAVQKLNGTIELQTKVKHVTSFIISLPNLSGKV